MAATLWGMSDLASTPDSTRTNGFEWVAKEAESGLVFRLGPDRGFRDGARQLRIRAMTSPSAEYNAAAIEAVETLSLQWGGPIEIVLDFEGHGPPAAGEAVALCQSLVASNAIEKIVLLKKSWMPKFIVSAVIRALSASGVPVELREAS
jgi:hypothetical protein